MNQCNEKFHENNIDSTSIEYIINNYEELEEIIIIQSLSCIQS